TEISNRKWLLYVNSSREFDIGSFKRITEQIEEFENLEFLRLPLYTIVYIHSDNHYLHFYLDYGPNTAPFHHEKIQIRKRELPHSSRMTIRGKIGDLDRILEPYNFMCIHSRYLLNMNFCEEFTQKTKNISTAGSGGEVTLGSTDNNSPYYESVLKVSRDGAKRLKEKL
ncbi:MAG: hypothetical protein AAFY76_03470, partial [Cyanobacteria bacterium J06649_11]